MSHLVLVESISWLVLSNFNDRNQAKALIVAVSHHITTHRITTLVVASRNRSNHPNIKRLHVVEILKMPSRIGIPNLLFHQVGNDLVTLLVTIVAEESECTNFTLPQFLSIRHSSYVPCIHYT